MFMASKEDKGKTGEIKHSTNIFCLSAEKISFCS